MKKPTSVIAEIVVDAVRVGSSIEVVWIIVGRMELAGQSLEKAHDRSHFGVECIGNEVSAHTHATHGTVWRIAGGSIGRSIIVRPVRWMVAVGIVAAHLTAVKFGKDAAYQRRAAHHVVGRVGHLRTVSTVRAAILASR